jgi:hypothetical protein
MLVTPVVKVALHSNGRHRVNDARASGRRVPLFGRGVLVGTASEADQVLCSEAEQHWDWKFTPSPTLRFLALSDRQRGTSFVADYRAVAMVTAKAICALDEFTPSEISEVESRSFLSHA